MSKLKSLKDYWDDRAQEWKIGVPLILNEEEVDFQYRHLKRGGNTLILGATRELCAVASEVSSSVTSVDFSQSVIDKLRLKGVKYICSDWSQYLVDTDQKFDNIMTDGGMLCLEFPSAWQDMADLINSHLKPDGIFSAKVYVSTPEPPKTSYENPNLNRFVPSMAKLDSNWSVHPGHEAYKEYDMYYTFPPDKEVERIFGQLLLHEKFVPSYEEGDRFLSYAWLKK